MPKQIRPSRPGFTFERPTLFGPVSARLYVGSSETMPELEDESITLTVTSPPYWNAIDYDKYAEDEQAFYRSREYGPQDYEAYLDWMVRIFDEVRRVTRPGGTLAIVVGTVLHQGRLYPLPFDLTTRLVRAGWEFHQDIIWHKTTAGVKRAGVFIQHPYPGYYRPNIMTEYILLFRKPGPPLYRQVDPARREPAKMPIDELFVQELANNIWHIAPVPPGQLNHPAPFPEEIPYRLIQFFSYPGDVILDPFLGSGQTAKVALALGRHAVGYDIVAKYVQYAHQRLAEPLQVRAEQLVARFEKIPLNAPRGYLKRRRAGAKTRHGSGRPARRS
ncbi:MAG: site-specific DNA-methyltransferase [Chloroflexi bacterium]|nr:site-specific DNA-methyltransferase [Chloroflexota bacterium]